jgi:hypothetical protein
MDPYAFYECSNLAGVYFTGNALSVDWPPSPNYGASFPFPSDNATVYYLPGTTGWDQPFFAAVPLLLWNPQIQTSDSTFGVASNGFGFPITGTPNIPIVVEATTDFAVSPFVPPQSCTLTNGSIYFTDPDWTNHPARFYRLRSP